MLIANNAFIRWVLNGGSLENETPKDYKELYQTGEYAINAIGFDNNGDMVQIGTISREMFTWNTIKFSVLKESDRPMWASWPMKSPPYSHDAVSNPIFYNRYNMPRGGSVAFGGAKYIAAAISSEELAQNDNALALSANWLVKGRVIGNAPKGLDQVIYYKTHLAALRSIMRVLAAELKCVDGGRIYEFSGPPTHAIMLAWALVASSSPGFAIQDARRDGKRLSATIRFFTDLPEDHWILSDGDLVDFMSSAARNPVNIFPRFSVGVAMPYGVDANTMTMIGPAGAKRVYASSLKKANEESESKRGDVGYLGNMAKLFKSVDYVHESTEFIKMVNLMYRPTTKRQPDYIDSLMTAILDNFPASALLVGEVGVCAMFTLLHRHLYYPQSVMIPETDVGFANGLMREAASENNDHYTSRPDGKIIADIAEKMKIESLAEFARAVRQRGAPAMQDLYKATDAYGAAIRSRLPLRVNIGRHRAVLLPPRREPHAQIGSYARWMFLSYGVLPRSGVAQICNIVNLMGSLKVENVLSLITKGVYDVK